MPEQFKDLENALWTFVGAIQNDRDLNVLHADITASYIDQLTKLSSLLGTTRLEVETLLGKALRERNLRSTYGESRFYTVKRSSFYSCLDWLSQGVEGPWSGLDFAKSNCKRRNNYERSKNREEEWIVIGYDLASNSFVEIKDGDMQEV